MKKKKLIKELVKAREELRRLKIRYNTDMDRMVEARLPNPYIYSPHNTNPDWVNKGIAEAAQKLAELYEKGE